MFHYLPLHTQEFRNTLQRLIRYSSFYAQGTCYEKVPFPGDTLTPAHKGLAIPQQGQSLDSLCLCTPSSSSSPASYD